MSNFLNNPYSDLGSNKFWKTGVAEESPFFLRDIYNKKYSISQVERIATAGSCFAQHISRYLRDNQFNLLDVEPPPRHYLRMNMQNLVMGLTVLGLEISIRLGNSFNWH